MESDRLLARVLKVSAAGLLALSSPLLAGDEPLHERIDRLIEASHSGPLPPLSTDAEFLRRAFLDLAGIIPSSADARRFLDDTEPEKRRRLVDELLGSPRYARHLATFFDLTLMERRAAKHVKAPEWQEYLRASLRDNKRYDQIAREILLADSDSPLRPAARFFLDRDGQPNVLTRDVGRMFFGMDLQCAQCHDHPLVDDYLQEDYYGLYAFISRSYLFEDKKKKMTFLAEKADGEASFKSVFTGESGKTLPRLPGGAELPDPPLEKGKEYKVAPAKGVRPVPAYSRRARLAEEASRGENDAFNRNVVNRLWALLMGRGLVEPPDLHHSGNPPSHPELLRLLAGEFRRMGYDVEAFLRELALTRTYQRSSAPPAIELAPEDARQIVAERERRRSELEGVLPASRAAWSSAREEEEKALAALEETRSKLGNASTAERAARKAVEETTVRRSAADRQLKDREEARALAVGAARKARDAAKRLGEDEELIAAAAKIEARVKELAPEIEAARKGLDDADRAARGAAATLEERCREVEAARSRRDEATARRADVAATVLLRLRELEGHQARRDQCLGNLEETRKLLGTTELVAAGEKARREAGEVSEELRAVRESIPQLDAELSPARTAEAKAREVAARVAAALGAARKELAREEDLARILDEAARQAEAAAKKLGDDEALTRAAGKIRGRAEEIGTQVAALRKAVAALESREKATGEEHRTRASSLEELESRLGTARQRAEQLAARGRSLEEAAAAREAERDRALEEVHEVWRRRFAISHLKPLGPEQLAWSLLRCLGIYERVASEVEAEIDKEAGKPATRTATQTAAAPDVRRDDVRRAEIEKRVHGKLQGHLSVFVSLYGGLPGAPQREFHATPQQALFVLHSRKIHDWLKPAAGNLTERLSRMESSTELADELYLSVLSRRPTAEESKAVEEYLAASQDRRAAAPDLVWALISSAEFRFNR